MRKKRTAAQFFDNATINGYEPLYETHVNGNTVAKEIEDDIKLNYKQMLDLWDKYVLSLMTLHNYNLMHIH